jgi:RHS repeat-associated protein
MQTPIRPLFSLTILLAVGRELLPGRRAFSLLFALLLYTQAIVPPSIAAARATVAGDTGRAVGRLAARSPAKSFAHPSTVSPATETFGVVLTSLNTAFNQHAGIDYHQQSRSVVVSANSPAGQPHNFELIDDAGAHRAFSNISNLGGALKIATARDDGQGASLGGFRKGELFTGTGAPGVVARVAPDGVAVQNPWVTLTGETGLPAGLHVDRTGIFGGDLVVVTDAGGVWRINAAGIATSVASLGTPLSGVTTIPNDIARYGPWAGKILAGAKERGAVYAVDAQGGATSYPLGINPAEIELVPPHENFFGLDPAAGKIWGAPADAFTSLIGDVLVAQGSPGVLARVRWNGTEFETGQIAQVAAWGQITFAPAGVAEIRAVKQVYDKIAVVRHAPVLNSGRVEGALWQLKAENVALGGTDTITSDLLVPGSPTVNVGGGHPTFAGVIEGVEDAQPTGYSVSLGANASLRHLITRTNPIELTPVAAPPTPAGARDVSITKEGESVGDFSTLRNLSLSGKAGAVSVPPGTYGGFSLGGRAILVLGVENSIEPSVYNLQNLTLSGGSELRLAGPVALTIRNGVSLTGSTVGAADTPRRMMLKVASGEVKVGGDSVLYGIVRAPQSLVEISGRGRVRGTVTCDRLTVNGNGVLQITESDIAPPQVNRPPTVDAGADQTVTLPTDTVSLNGTASDDGLPQGGTMRVQWSVSSAPGAVSFGNPASAVTTAVFAMPGIYILKLTASDGRLTRSDFMQVEVVPRNQPPAVNAGADQTIKLSDSANLNGTVTDDALPHGSIVNVNWSVSSGPGAVSFASPNAAATTVSFAAPGVYTLKLSANDSEFEVADEVVVNVNSSNQPPDADAGTDQTLAESGVVPAPAEFRLSAISTGFNSPIGIDYHQPTNKVVMSVNYNGGGQPHNFELIAADGTHSRFSNISGLTDELKLATARDDGGGMSLGGFRAGELFTGSGAPGVIVRVTADGSAVQNPWVTLPGENGLMRGSLYVDRTGVFGGDLIAVTTAGGVWRINAAGQATQLARIPTHLEGLSTIPDIPQKYGPWAGKILIGAEQQRGFYTVDARGNTAFFDLGISPEDIDIIPENENFFGVDFGSSRLMGAPAAAFRDMVGDILVAQEGPGVLYRVHWNGAAFEETPLAGVAQWEHVTFAPAGIVEVAPVGTTVTLHGTVTDDAAPGFPLSIAWEKVSGPGTVSFGSPAQAVTTATLSRPGTYVLRLTGNDTEFGDSDEVTVVISPRLRGRVYTRNADFDEGSFINVTHAVPDQLQLDETARTLNFIWVAVSSKGTVVKLDTETGAVLGEYFTSPNGQPRNPSRTTVDQNGNVWATNRDGNSVLHVGLAENGQCVDRNGNGVIDTSHGYGDIRPWTNAGEADTGGGVATAQDECIIHYTKVNSSGTRHVSVTTGNDIWVSGTGGQRFDLIDGKTGLVKRSEPSVGYGGYGGLIDKSGVIWSARPLLRWDTANPLTGPQGGNWSGYGHDSYGLCIDSKGNVWNTSLENNQIFKFAPDGTRLGVFNHGSYWAQGCVVDKNDDVWVAHSLNDVSVGHLKNNGQFIGNVSVGSGPTGVAVDGKGKIWATNHNSGDVSRIDPNLGAAGADGVTHVGAVDFTSQYLGGNLYNYSDMTGSTLSGAPDHGTWSTVFDSQTAGSQWGRIGWTARVCGDGLLTVSVASGEDGATFSQPLIVSNGDDPAVPSGRYLKVIVKFERASSGESPVLYDLSVGMVDFSLPTQANLAPDVDAGTDQTINGATKTALRGAACDDALPSNRKLAISWSKVSGPGAVTFTRPNSLATEVTFGATGTYELKLTAGDSAFTQSDTVIVEVVPGNEPPVVNAGADQAVTHPDAAALNGTVADDGLPRSGTLFVAWSKVSGPGGVTFSNPNAASTAARFGAPGTYVLRLTASDTDAASHDEVTVSVGGTNQPPEVNAGTDQTITLPNTATLGGAATDDGWPEGNPLAVSWSVVSGPATVTFNNPNQAATSASFNEPGDYVLRLSADDSQLSASDEVIVKVNPPIPPPNVSIDSLPDGAEVTTRLNVFGTVSEGANWRLEYAAGDGAGSTWTTLASGHTPVAGGLLGVFDPTLLLNGIYTLRLIATDAAAQTTTASVGLVVHGRQKIGNVTLSFGDLELRMAGLPIEITRTYDSRDKRSGDFGVGWTLGLRNARLEKNGPLGLNWQQTSSGGFFPTYCVQPTRPHIVTITFPDDEVYQFQAITTPQCQGLVPLQTASVRFAPRPGTLGTLSVVGNSEVLVAGSAPGPVDLFNDETADLFDARLFQLRTQTGMVYVIDQQGGVRSMTDTNGNTLTITPQGITHSSGKSVSFTRDALGRITRITDPAGKVMDYTYDAAGDLVSYRDREDNTVSFTYNTEHGLLTLKDPRGLEPIRNEYDDEGRIIRHTDAAGNVVTYTHNVSARQEMVTDRLGRLTISEYDERGNVVRSVDAAGGVTAFAYDASDNLLSQTNPLGQTTSFTYDALNNRTSITEPPGQITRYTYNALGQPLTVTDALGQITTVTYDSAGHPLTVKDPLGNTASFSYNPANGLPASITHPGGHITRYEYDAAGNLSKQASELGGAVTYAYDLNGQRTSQAVTRTLPDGQTETLAVSYEYDHLGRIVKTTLPDGSTTGVVYDEVGQQTATVDQLGRQTTYAYDDVGRLIQTTYPDGLKESNVYDAEGRRLTSTDRAGRVTRYTYDALDRVIKVTYPDGTWVSTAYNALGQATALTDALGHVTAYEYDAGGRRTKITDPLNQFMTFAYNAIGQKVSQTDAKGSVTKYEYDADNRLTKVVYPDSTTTLSAYDAMGRVVAQTDQGGQTVRSSYDALGRLVQVTDALGQVTQYGYNELGQQISQTDANSHTTRFEYDKAGRRTKRTLPLGMSETYTYNAAGNLLTRTDFNGKTTTYAYDALNRLSSKTPDPRLNQPAVTYTYTANGKRAGMTDATGTTLYIYDEMDRLTSKTSPAGKLVYTYDAVGNLLTTRSLNPNGASVDYSYDSLNRLASVNDNRLDANANTTTYSYDSIGNLQAYRYPNGVRAAYTYNSLNRLTDLTVSNAASTIASYRYTLGSAGNRLAVTELSGRTVQYQYDAMYRLTGETIAGDPHAANGTSTYGYDPVGNRLSRASTLAALPDQTFTYDANDRPTTDTHDLNGNTIAAGGNAYSFDWENHLTGINNSAVTFLYDGDGQRVGKRTGQTTTMYLIDTNNLTGFSQVVDELTDGAVTRSYTYGHSLISQRQRTGGDWRVSFYGFDGQSSVRQLTDSAGSVTDTYTYDAYGNLLTRTGTTPNERLYNGEQLDAHAGFYYLRARYLNPASGRFMSMDSYEGESSDPRSLHKYLYAFANPANRRDPSGHESIGDQYLKFCIWSYVMVWPVIGPYVIGGLVTLNVIAALYDFEQFLLIMAFSGNPAEMGALVWASFRKMGQGVTAASAGIKEAYIRIRYPGGNLTQFWTKALRYNIAADSGGAFVAENTSAIRLEGAQAAFRRLSITMRTNQLSRYGEMTRSVARAIATKEFSTMHADHMIDLQLSFGMANPNSFENLWMLDAQVNTSLGAQIQAEIRRLGLVEGDKILGFIIEGPPLEP